MEIVRVPGGSPSSQYPCRRIDSNLRNRHSPSTPEKKKDVFDYFPITVLENLGHDYLNRRTKGDADLVLFASNNVVSEWGYSVAATMLRSTGYSPMTEM